MTKVWLYENSKTVILLFTNLGLFAKQPLLIPCNKNATAQTKALFQNLNKIAANGYLPGHQDNLAYGINGRYFTKVH